MNISHRIIMEIPYVRNLENLKLNFKQKESMHFGQIFMNDTILNLTYNNKNILFIAIIPLKYAIC